MPKVVAVMSQGVYRDAGYHQSFIVNNRHVRPETISGLSSIAPSTHSIARRHNYRRIDKRNSIDLSILKADPIVRKWRWPGIRDSCLEQYARLVAAIYNAAVLWKNYAGRKSEAVTPLYKLTEVVSS